MPNTSVAGIGRYHHLLVPGAILVEFLVTHLTQHLGVHLGSMPWKRVKVVASSMLFALGLSKVSIEIDEDLAEILQVEKPEQRTLRGRQVSARLHRLGIQLRALCLARM
jgi:hypothetical protein